MIVVDVNILAYFVLRGENAALASSVAEKDSDWRAPRLWRSEMLNILSGYIRRGTLSVGTAMHAFQEADLAVKAQVPVDEWRVLELVNLSACSSYDCEYVAVAEALQVPLITNDKQIWRSFPRAAISMQDFLGL